MRKPLLIKSISIVDAQHFKVIWNDDKESIVKLADLQRACPCRRCCDVDKGAKISDDLTAKSLENIGRYAVKINFEKGCSSGIYPFSLIRNIAGLIDNTGKG